MTRPGLNSATATAALLLAVALLMVLGPWTESASAQVEENCNPPDDGEWDIRGDKTVTCVDRTIQVRNLTVTQGATLNLHEVTLLINSKTAPNGGVWGVIMVDRDTLNAGTLNVKDSVLKPLDGHPRPRISIYANVYATIEASDVIGFDAVLISAPSRYISEGDVIIRDSRFLDLRRGITDFGAPSLSIEGNFISGSIDGTAIYTEGTPVIRNNVITTCHIGIIIKYNSAQPVIEDNTITHCKGGIGHEMATAPQAIHDNDIFENRYVPPHLTCTTCPTGEGGAHGNAEDNWWGTDPPDASRMFSPMDYTPWRTSPVHPERLPRPDVTAQSTAFVNDAVSFDASDSLPSTKYDFALTDYEWNFGDGATAKGSIVTHTYDTPGSYEVRVLVRDEWNLSMPWTSTITIQNRAPEISAVIQPSQPYATNDLQAVAETTDADGDDVELSYQWRQNGQLQNDLTTNTVPASRVASTDTWSVTVTATDAHGATTSETASVSIPNRAPEVTSLAITPTSPLATDSLAAVFAATDPDDDEVTVSYEWRRNGQIQANLKQDKVPATHVRSTDKWSITVIAADKHGATDVAVHQVVIPNRAPEITSLAFEPDAPRRGQDLRASTHVIDLDDDAVTLTYVWHRNGQVTDETKSTVPGDALIRGDTWSVTVTVTDGHDEVTASDLVQVQNTAPEVVSLFLDASKAGQDIEASVEVVDADDDEVDLAYEWRQNGQARIDLTGPVVAGADVVSGDVWVLTVTPSDDGLQGEAVSVKAVIGNHVPTIQSLTMSPMDATAATPLRIAVKASDIDGDDLVMSYAWFQNGEATKHDKATVPVDALKRGDSWRVRVTVTDGKSEAKQLSGAVVIQNASPTITQVLATPTMPVVGDSVELSVEAVDADEDSVIVSWILPDGSTAHGALVSTTFPDPGVVEVPYTVTDGEAEISGSLMVMVQAAPAPKDPEDELVTPGDVDSGSDLDGDLGLDATGEDTKKEASGIDDAPGENVGDPDKQAPLPGAAILLALVAVVAARRRN